MREAGEPEEVEQEEEAAEEQVDVGDRQEDGEEKEGAEEQVDVGDRQEVEVKVVVKQMVGVPGGEWLHSLPPNVAQTYCF